jgi:uncharacterized protein YjbJ (UPF0337 family)
MARLLLIATSKARHVVRDSRCSPDDSSRCRRANVAAQYGEEVLVMPNEEQLEGNLEQARGDIKEKVGDAIGNEQMEIEGNWDKAKGTVREGVGDLREGVDEATEDLDDKSQPDLNR